jgi:hypothetical protein
MKNTARSRRLIAAFAVCAAMSPGLVAAEPTRLDLVCRLHETRGQAHRELRRRLEIDLQARTVRVSDDVGRGWQVKNQYPFVSADAGRIVLESAGGKTSAVDRHTGLYSFHNQSDGVTMRGPCEKAPPPGPAKF